MSIAVLTQVYAEARRLAIAGSVVAAGDFRLKKLVPPLEAAGKQAPVFAKVAEAATKVIDGPEASSAEALLELTSLVNAVLYTQGETGLAGRLEAVETTDLGGSVAQTSARVLKPLLEALSNTGSGRLELVKDAHDRGLFRDLRLVKPALAGLDDPYPEIADLIAEKVLPLYGKAILPELRAKYDAKGTKGHPRRLKLMHGLDPAGTKELVKAALDDGSKEVKVAAIACLGSDDLPFLVEQAAAKAQDVRSAAYRALAKIDKPEAVAVLTKALAGKDYDHASSAIEASGRPSLADLMVVEIRSQIDTASKSKDKKKTDEALGRAMHLIRSFPEGDRPTADALLLDLFARRGELAKTKGQFHSGTDVAEAVQSVMVRHSPATQKALVAARNEITPEFLELAFDAGRYCLSAKELYDTFVPYLTAKFDAKSKKDPARLRREALSSGLGSIPYEVPDGGDWKDRRPETELDPRWLDAAVKTGDFDLVRSIPRPGHASAQAFVKAEYDAAFAKAKSHEDLDDHLEALFEFRHPAAPDAFFAALAKRPKKAGHCYTYTYARLVPRLSKDQIPRLEEFVANTKLPDHEANYWLDAIQQLRMASE